MGSVLQIDHEEMDDAVTGMNAAYNQFKEITSDGFETELGYLDAMNSDFVDKLTQVLEIAEDWDLANLTKNIKKYVKKAKKINEEIAKADDDLSISGNN